MAKNSKVNHTAYYADTLKVWQASTMGPRPTADQFATAHLLGNRQGVEALHIAMCLRPTGCTVRQFCTAGSCGPANNKRRLMVSRGLAKVDVKGKPYGYFMTLTAKGTALVKANEAKAAAGEVTDKPKAAKGKGAAKVTTKAKRKAATRKPKAPKAPAAPQVPQGDAPQADNGTAPQA